MSAKEKVVVMGHTLERLLLDNNVRTKAIEKLLVCLDAKRSFYDNVAKKTITEPDYKTISATCIALLAYTDGRPVERKEVVVHTSKTLAELRQMAKASPELQASIKALMEFENPATDV